MNLKYILFFALLGLKLAFTQPPHKIDANDLRNKENETFVGVEATLNIWRADTFGSQGFKSLDTVKLILDSLQLKGKSTEFVLEKLGNPNFRISDDNIENFGYYFDRFCIGNLHIDSVDFCWLELVFYDGFVTNYDNQCF